MKHFKNANNDVYAFESDGSQDHLIKSDMVEITIEEMKILTTPVITTEMLITNTRNKRNLLLSKSDWTQLPDVAQATKDKWAPYRQALRDITLQPEFPNTIIWPAEPV